MGRSPCCAKEGLNRGAWTAMEDEILTDYIEVHGEGKWRNLPKRAGLKRCGKSCRLRWLNYLRPDIKRGNISRDEEDLIIRLHKLLGNRWSLIAGRLPGRTDNEIKNYWNTNIGKKMQGQPSCTSNRQSANQSKEKPSPTIEQSFGQPPSPNIESWAVRTKASRCTRVFIGPVPQNPRLVDPNLVVGPPKIHDQDPVCDRAVGPEPMSEISPFISLEDHPSDFILDFDMDEKFLSDFLISDFAPLCDFDSGLKGDNDTNTSSSSPDSNETLLLHDSDLQSMAALLDPGMDWLQN